jgi:hypothetical protein
MVKEEPMFPGELVKHQADSRKVHAEVKLTRPAPHVVSNNQ